MAGSLPSVRMARWPCGKLLLWRNVFTVREFYSIQALAFTPDGQSLILAVGTYNNPANLAVLEVQTGRTLYILDRHSWGPEGVAVSPDGRWIASGSSTYKQTLTLWNAASRQELFTWDAHAGSRVQAVAFAPDGQYLVTGSDDNTARMWGTSPLYAAMGTSSESGTMQDQWIRIKCESCGVGIKCPRTSAGKKGKCPKCHNEVQVPK